MCLRCEGGGGAEWVRRFSVDETRRHPGGFTVYKITSVLFPLATPEAATVVVVWKRHRDVRALHSRMINLHAALHLSGTPPPLAKASFTSRFKPNVIAERARTTQQLMEFVAQHRLLFTAADFVSFLQNGYTEPPPSDGGVTATTNGNDEAPSELIAPVLTPIKSYPLSPAQEAKSDSPSPPSTHPLPDLLTHAASEATEALDNDVVDGATEEEGPETPHQTFARLQVRIERLLREAYQEQESSRRRELKLEASECLDRAESIYTHHLADNNDTTEREHNVSRTRQSSIEVDSTDSASLRVPRSELALYRVLAVGEGGVTLLHSRTQQRVSLQVVAKQCEDDASWLLPRPAPYTGRLLAYADAPHALFLMTERAHGPPLVRYAAERNVGAGVVRRWAAELLLAVEHIHKQGLVLRDLSASELFLGTGGALQVRYRVCASTPHPTLCRACAASPPPPHIAPELHRPDLAEDTPDLLLQQACDWWSYGAILYQLVCGWELESAEPGRTPRLPRNLCTNTESLLTQLLQYDPRERLGVHGAEEVREHPYFRHVDFHLLLNAWRNNTALATPIETKEKQQSPMA